MSWFTFFRRGHKPRPAVYLADPASTVSALMARDGLAVLTDAEIVSLLGTLVEVQRAGDVLSAGEKQCVELYVQAARFVCECNRAARLRMAL